MLRRSSVLFNPEQPRAKRAGGGTGPAQKLRIGVVDGNTYASRLRDVFEHLNLSQSAFNFTQVIVPLRRELLVSGIRTKKFASKLGLPLTKAELANNVYAPDLLDALKPVHSKLGFDALGVIVASMLIDGEKRSDIEANLFSTSRGRLFAASAFDLREYSAVARRPFELSLAVVAIAQALQAIFKNVQSHDETRGCLFDYCEDRDDLIRGLQKISICAESLAQIPAARRSDVLKLVAALESYDRQFSPSEQQILTKLRSEATADRRKKS